MNKELVSYKKLFDYYLIKSEKRIKTLSLKLINNEFYLYVPARINKQVINDFLEKHKKYILEHLNNKLNSNILLYLGDKYSLEIEKTKLLIIPKVHPHKNTKTLIIYQPINSDVDISYTLTKWKKEELLKILQDRIKFYICKYKFNFDVNKNKLRVKNVNTLWGSCSKYCNLNFNIKLIEQTPEIIDYVIVHELSHTVYHNHSKQFWKYVENIIPNYKDLRKKLKSIL